MCKPSIKINKPLVALLATLTLLLPVANAAQSDFEQEVVIQAKRQASDLKNKIASYLDDVKITQGSLTITADVVQVINDPNSQGKSYQAKGKPARFSQRLDDGKLVEIQAQEITYTPLTSTLVIKGNAKVSQEGSQVQGDIITYNMLTEQLTAESLDDSDIVTTIIQPQKKDNNTTEQNEQQKPEPEQGEEQ
ncbi:lipopolysaccharide transport periplasmic protein LptA [Thalassotalea litorea]|uniref:Lipopolysaccharide export system protein LptA n=1 Tax=Thalassotalea litorea TaxID=2020715 RepID=A0A5R9IQC5_9GAMM|nr:lipopolysaccharide transport periplasmic protein LptA [Thalassotalea litorea]TLU66683.1 lipopolysaccharide transport periplasmic protein LptA [Thalassotalea litorea]